MGFLDDDAPWGSPVDDSIPLPPFADEAEHVAYVRKLQLHLALLDDGGPSLSTVTLSLALERRRGAGADAEDGWPTRLELHASLTSWFPAPWTPTVLARVLGRAGTGTPQQDRHGTWRWFDDPDFSAAPHPDGSWTVTRHERGARETAHLASDRDLIVLWLAHFRGRFAFPLAHHREAGDLAALAPAVQAVIAADERDAAAPYRATWRAERKAALDAARS